MSTLLPLFPLDLVLFPGTPLPLHIFEPRYKEMIGECLEQKKPFGIVRARDEGLAEIGCTAEIVRVNKEYDDGRMDILTAGRQRFELVAVDQSRSFLQAEVLFLDDELAAATEDQVASALQLHSELMQLAGSTPESEAEIERSQLAFHLAGMLPLDPDFKQNLLSMRSEAERVPALIAYLEAVLPRLRATVRARKSAGGNGHVH